MIIGHFAFSSLTHLPFVDIQAIPCPLLTILDH